MKRITCADLALGYACTRIFEAETDEEVVAQALAHARDEHSTDDLDEETTRAAIVRAARRSGPS